MRLAKSNSHMKNVAYKNQTFSICGSMSHAMKVKTINYHYSQCLLYAEIWAKQFIFIIPNVYFNAKREGPRKQSQEPGQQSYGGELLRTPMRDWPEQGWGDKQVVTEASANLKWGEGTGMSLQSRPELGQGGCIFVFQHRMQAAPGEGAWPWDRQLPWAKRTSFQEFTRKPWPVIAPSSLWWGGGVGGRLTSVSLLEEGLRSVSQVYERHVIHPYLTE